MANEYDGFSIKKTEKQEKRKASAGRTSPLKLCLATLKHGMQYEKYSPCSSEAELLW